MARDAQTGASTLLHSRKRHAIRAHRPLIELGTLLLLAPAVLAGVTFGPGRARAAKRP